MFPETDWRFRSGLKSLSNYKFRNYEITNSLHARFRRTAPAPLPCGIRTPDFRTLSQVHWPGARWLCGAAGPGRGGPANPGDAWLAYGRSNGRTHGKGRAASLSGEVGGPGSYRREAGDIAEVPRRRRGSIGKECCLLMSCRISFL